jgi:hypothetical protein
MSLQNNDTFPSDFQMSFLALFYVDLVYLVFVLGHMVAGIAGLAAMPICL